ncbi:MAG: hypothetical protein RDU24_02675 [Humidesulfovibrio sp.]|uniref:hypothetical protein n=1 Tax=Humidesulfovibrio sp. TaxID=2910988 RepID=UPI0027EDC2AE|nr:hypothetical protein [Humidesulfovibrio sp.]MDQ7834263.1 hypothetical protein [Humidesulfovibrio sp.]
MSIFYPPQAMAARFSSVINSQEVLKVTEHAPSQSRKDASKKVIVSLSELSLRLGGESCYYFQPQRAVRQSSRPNQFRNYPWLTGFAPVGYNPCLLRRLFSQHFFHMRPGLVAKIVTGTADSSKGAA